MLNTSTSKHSAHDDALLRISAYFILRRGRGSTLSASDIDALESWARDGYAWLEILAAIDEAFAKLRTPPSTLRGVRRFLPKNELLEELLDPRILEAAFGAPQPDTHLDAPTPDSNPAAAATAKAKAALQEAAARANSELARSCYLDLLQELEDREAEGPVPPDTLAILDEALALYGLERLPTAQRERIEREVEQAHPTMRTRTLLERVGAALGFEYPNLQRLT